MTHTSRSDGVGTHLLSDAPTLRQLFYYNRSVPYSLPSINAHAGQTSPSLVHERAIAAAAEAEAEAKAGQEAAAEEKKPLASDDPVDQQPESAPVKEAREDEVELEGADSSDPQVSERLHGFFQHNVVMPYTHREKTMNFSNLGWLPKDALLDAMAHKRHLEIPQRRYDMMGPSRPRCRRIRPPLYEAPDGANRYRKIEDLSLFVRTGTLTAETEYFRDPMLRRLREDVIFASPQQKVIQQEDPRLERVWTDDGKKSRAQAKLQSVVPHKAQLCKLKHDHSTGLVKPYALGKSAHVASSRPFAEFAIESAMDSFVTSMQCQRPNKGVRGPMAE